MSKVFLRAIVVASTVITLFSLSSFATVYYVDSAAGKDTNSGTSTSAPWKTLAKVSSHSYVAGDQILLKAGDTWREQISVRSSGASGKPITYGAYGSGNQPVINGADLVGNWSGYSGYIYRASIAWAPTHVWYNGTLLTKATGISGVNAAGKWYYSSSSLYVWAPGNVNPTGHAVEADRRSRAFDIASHSYITINGISMKNSTSQFVAAWNAGHVTVQNSTMKNAWIAVYAQAASPYLVVDHCTFAVDSGYVGRDFVLVSSTTADNPVVSNNVIGNINGYVVIMFNDVSNAQAYNNTMTGSGGGIETASTTRTVTGALFHDNAIFASDHRLVDGESIKIRGTPPYTASATIYRNYIKGGPYTWDGIGGWYADNSLVYSNIVMDCAQYGIQFTLDSSNNTFANNTIYKNVIAGIALYTRGSAKVENNIIQSAGVGISADTGVTVSEDYNIISQVTTLRSTSIHAGSHTTTASPSFVSSAPASSNDFKLKSGSPAIGSGNNLGTPYNMVLDPDGAVFPYPAINQNSYGSWERGAFLYR
jgi:parallel beta-helix repeat protein